MRSGIKILAILAILFLQGSCKEEMTYPGAIITILSAESVNGIELKPCGCSLNVYIKDKCYDEYYEKDSTYYLEMLSADLKFAIVEIVNCGEEHGFNDDDGNWYWGAHPVGVKYHIDQTSWFMSKFDFFKSVDFKKVIKDYSGNKLHIHYMSIKSVDVYCTNSNLFDRPAGSSLADKFRYVNGGGEVEYSYPDFWRIEAPNGIVLSEIGKYNVIPLTDNLRLWPTSDISKEDFVKLNFKVVMVTEDEFYGERTFESDLIHSIN